MVTIEGLHAIQLSKVRHLFGAHHVYKGASGASTYCFAWMEKNEPVAAFVWQPPPPGAADSVCPEAPYGVLSLSRMVALPHAERALKHISKPLKTQMRRLIDRGRWPVLVTYSDEGAGHTGHVYKCSGWQPTHRAEVPFHVNADGVRVSRYNSGKKRTEGLILGGSTTIQRWEHRVCPAGETAAWIEAHGWRRVLTGGTWNSGNPAATWVKVDESESPQLGLFAE